SVSPRPYFRGTIRARLCRTGKSKTHGAFFFSARRSGPRKGGGPLRDSREAGLLSVSAQAGALAAKCSPDLPAPGSLSTGYVPHRHAVPFWLFAKVTATGPENRSDRLSLGAADARIHGTSACSSGSARKRYEGTRPGFVRAARLRPHGQRAARALESNG